MKPKDNEFANIQYLLMIVNVLPLLRTALIAFYKWILLGTLAWKHICVGEMSLSILQNIVEWLLDKSSLSTLASIISN